MLLLKLLVRVHDTTRAMQVRLHGLAAADLECVPFFDRLNVIEEDEEVF